MSIAISIRPHTSARGPQLRLSRSDAEQIELRYATPADRQRIYAERHAIYARELGQHPPNAAGTLRDPLDEFNIYLVAAVGGELAGFVSITPPGRAYSVDKYFPGDKLPFARHAQLYEVRLLSVLADSRGGVLAPLLMYAAFRYVQSRGGTQIGAIGRREVVAMYERIGMTRLGLHATSGNVAYELMCADVVDLQRRAATDDAPLVERLENAVDWRLDMPLRAPAPCFHGGAFFDAVGPRFDDLSRRANIINADVLDAWFDPSPAVLTSLREHLPWLLRTSPPTHCEGLVDAIAAARGVDPACIVPGAGSSDLMFRILPRWLSPSSRVLILDPMYGEYAHILEHVVRCRMDRLMLSEQNDFAIDPNELLAAIRRNYDLIILVNPNSPTGRHLPRAVLAPILAQASAARTRVWVDETYIDYVSAAESVERFAATSESVVVVKSMSKIYALSGARAAYLCGPRHLLDPIRAVTPPWVVGLPTQVAAVAALSDPSYYLRRYAETHALRLSLSSRLAEILGIVRILPGVANFVLCRLDPAGPAAAEVVTRCRAQGVFLRDAANMSTQLGTHMLRIAVKSDVENQRIAAAVSGALHP